MTIASLSRIIPLGCKYTVIKHKDMAVLAYFMPFEELVTQYNEEIVLQITPAGYETMNVIIK